MENIFRWSLSAPPVLLLKKHSTGSDMRLSRLALNNLEEYAHAKYNGKSK